MALLSYNGVTIGIGGLLEQLAWDRHSEYDGPTFLGIRHRIRVRGSVNPASISYVGGTTPPFQNPDPPPANFLRGQTPGSTDLIIRERLSRPQAQLVYSIGNVIALQSPAFGFSLDADNGPVPIVHSCDINPGDQKTWWVDFEVSTLVQTCGTFDPPPDIVNSHRWVMTHDLDSEGLCSRTISGHVYFNTARMIQFGQDAAALLGIPVGPVVPDQFRGWLFHPPFPNSRRELIRCEPNADGDEISYTIRDVELPINLYALGATRVQIVHSAEVNYEGPEAAIRRLLHTNILDPNLGAILDFASLGQVAWDAGWLGGMALNDYFGPQGKGVLSGAMAGALAALPYWVQGLFSSGGNNGNAGNVVNLNNIPVVTIACVVKVWGNRNTTRYNLQNLGIQLCMARLNLSLTGLSPAFSTAAKLTAGKAHSIRHDPAGKYVEVAMAINSQALGFKIVQSLSQTVGSNLLTMPDLTWAFPYQQHVLPDFSGIGPGTQAVPDPLSDETPTYAPGGNQGLNTLNIGPQVSSGFLSDGQTRGSYLGLAVSQALLAPCEQSPYPQDPPQVDLTGADQSNPFKSWSPP